MANCKTETSYGIEQLQQLNPKSVEVVDSGVIGKDFKDVYDKIINIAADTKLKLKLTEHNVDNIFKYFTKNLGLQKLQANDAVSLFFGVMTGDENVYLHPTKQNVIVSHDKQIRIDSRKFEMFKAHFNTDCSPKEKMRLAAISDRLIEDTSRRRKGEFYTPTLFVDYSQQMISDQLGADWREKYVIWDPAWGTGNLTRDYQFKELYASTLEQAELEIGAKHNPEATKFKFDFLNDSLENLPTGLLEAFKQDKPVLFYLNPPYAACGGRQSYQHANIEKITDTLVKKMLQADNVSCRSLNLYMQFLYRILKIKEKYSLTNCKIAIFCPPNFIQNPLFNSFKQKFFSSFKNISTALFDSKHFNDVNYGAIMLSLWENGTEISNEISASVIDDTEEGVKDIGSKTLYSIDKADRLQNWFKEKSKHPCFFPQFKKVLNLHVSGRGDGNKAASDAIGYMYSHSNYVYMGHQHTCLFSAPYSAGTELVLSSNFDRCITAFSARTLCESDIFNHFDEFIAPDTKNVHWTEFVNDSLVYSLFSCQVSLRNIQFKDKVYNIHNNFFWLPKSEIEDLADQCNLDDVYADAHTASDRFVYKKLQGLELSKEAQAVLDKASELLKKSFKYRKLFSSEHPEYQLDKCWDAGWYQVKGLLKEYMKEELKEFNGLVKALGDKMRPMVYELGFLKNRNALHKK